MSKDYQLVEIAGVDKMTGYPVDQWGHVLDPFNKNGEGKAVELTSPYGSLNFAIGSSDDFHCFDYASLYSVEDTEGKRVPCCSDYISTWEMDPTHMALHSVINSETAHFIQDADKAIVPIVEAIAVARRMTDSALDWLYEGGKPIRHTKTGWNQDPYYFLRCVICTVKPPPFKVSDRMKRFGGKKIDSYCDL